MSETNSKPITRETPKTPKKKPARGVTHYALVEEVTQEDGTISFKQLPLPKGLTLSQKSDSKTAKIKKAIETAANEGDTTYQGKKMHVIYYTGDGVYCKIDPRPRFKITS